MHRSRPSRRGFTIVEMLVVVGITVLLIGILLPTLGAARKRAAKTGETNQLRQVVLAWNMYGNSNNGAALPAFMPPDVQDRWKVRFRFPGNTVIPQEFVARWPWRLMSYLDYEPSVLRGYLEEDDDSIMNAMMNQAESFSLTPAFGYNGLHLGGWWENREFGTQTRATTLFFDATFEDRPVNVVARSIGNVRRASEVVSFCSAFLPDETRLYKGIDRLQEGWHLVVPPNAGNEQIWGGGVGDPTVIEVFRNSIAGDIDVGVPIGRYTSQAVVAYVDGHLDTQGPGTLANQRFWIDNAETPDWTID